MWVGAIRCGSTWEERAQLFSRKKNDGTYRRGEGPRRKKTLLRDPGSETRLGREEEKKTGKMIKEMSKTKIKNGEKKSGGTGRI